MDGDDLTFTETIQGELEQDEYQELVNLRSDILNKLLHKLIIGNASLGRTSSGATCKGVLQLEATFIDVKNMYLHRDSNPSLWNTVPMI